MINKKCKNCSQIFKTRECVVKKGGGKFCSRECYGEGVRKGKELNCHICEKGIYRHLSVINKSKSKKFFCSKKCQTIWRNKFFSGEKSKRWIDGSNIYRDKLLNSKKEVSCGDCGNKDIRVLAVHHVDCNHANNNLENLKWLCHNCHHRVHYAINRGLK